MVRGHRLPIFPICPVETMCTSSLQCGTTIIFRLPIISFLTKQQLPLQRFLIKVYLLKIDVENLKKDEANTKFSNIPIQFLGIARSSERGTNPNRG